MHAIGRACLDPAPRAVGPGERAGGTQMAVSTFESLDQLTHAVGRDLGTSETMCIDGDRVRTFIASVGDDPTRLPDAVPPYLLLSLTNELLPQVVEIEQFSSGVNYGTGEVRFPHSLAIGSSVSATVTLVSADPVTGGVQTVMRIEVRDADDRAVCIVEAMGRYFY